VNSTYIEMHGATMKKIISALFHFLYTVFLVGHHPPEGRGAHEL